MKRPGEEQSATIDNSNKNTLEATQFHGYMSVEHQFILLFLERDFFRNCKAVLVFL